MKHKGRLPSFGAFQPVLKGGSLLVSALLEKGCGGHIAFGNDGAELVDAKMRGSVFGKQTEGFGGNALALLLRNNHDAHFSPLVHRLVVLQIDETDAAAIGRLNDEAKLTVAEDWPTSNILFEKFGRAVAKDLLE